MSNGSTKKVKIKKKKPSLANDSFFSENFWTWDKNFYVIELDSNTGDSVASDTEMSYALKEFIVILNNNNCPRNQLLYDTVFSKLIITERNEEKKFISLPELRETLDFDSLLKLNASIIADASYTFALFYIIKQMAYVAGFAKDYNLSKIDITKVLNPLLEGNNNFNKVSGDETL